MAVNVPGLIGVIVFYIVILVIGIIAGRKKKSTEQNANSEEVILAGRDIGMVVGVFTMTATWVGGGFINGTAEVVYLEGSGLVWCQAPVGYSISLILGGLFFAKKMRSAGYVTMIDPFQRKLGNIMGGVCFLPALLGELFWSAAILSALGSTISVIIDLNRELSIIISAIIALAYTVFGGLYSVAYTDVVQLLCILIGLVLAIPFAMTHEAVTPISETTSPEGGWLGTLSGYSWGLYIDSALLLICGGIPWQVYFQRVLSSKTVRGAQILSILGGIGCILLSIPSILIGATGYSADWNATSYDGELPPPGPLILPLVLQYLTPPAVSVIGLGAVSAAVMSSADSSMLSSSSMFARNIYKMIFRPWASERELVWVMRISSLGFAAISTLLAIFVKTIYGLFYLCSDLVYVVLFPQLVSVLYIPFTNVFGSASGFAVALLLRLLGGESILKFPPAIKYPWYDEASRYQYFPFKTLSMLIGFIVLVLVSFVTDRLMKSGRLRVDLDRLTYGFDDETSTARDSQESSDGVSNKGATFGSYEMEQPSSKYEYNKDL